MISWSTWLGGPVDPGNESGDGSPISFELLYVTQATLLTDGTYRIALSSFGRFSGGFVGVVGRLGLAFDRRELWCRQERTTERDTILSHAVAEESVMPDALEAGGKDVQEEPSDELGRLESHGALCAGTVILVAEGDLCVLERDQSLVGYGDAVSVAGQVLEYQLGSAERSLRVDDPFFRESFDKTRPLQRSPKVSKASVELEFAIPARLFEIVHKRVTKALAEDFDVDEEVWPRSDPAAAIWRQPSPRNDAVQVRMVIQALPPGVKDGKKADLCTQVLGITRDRLERLSGSAKEQSVDYTLVL